MLPKVKIESKHYTFRRVGFGKWGKVTSKSLEILGAVKGQYCSIWLKYTEHKFVCTFLQSLGLEPWWYQIQFTQKSAKSQADFWTFHIWSRPVRLLFLQQPDKPGMESYTHLAKRPSNLKQNGTQEKTPFSGTALNTFNMACSVFLRVVPFCFRSLGRFERCV